MRSTIYSDLNTLSSEKSNCSAHRSWPVREYEIRPPRCHSDPRTNTGRCCCDTGATCSNLPRHRRASTGLGDVKKNTSEVMFEVKEGVCPSVCLSVRPSHQAVSSPLASCWCWTVLLYKGNLKGRDKGLWWLREQNCSSLLFSSRRLCFSCAFYNFFFLLWLPVIPLLWPWHGTPLLEFLYIWQNQSYLCLRKTAAQVSPHPTQTWTLGFTTGSESNLLLYDNRIKYKAEPNKCVVKN